MNATRALLRFASASMAAYVALYYFGFAYESLLLFAADRVAQTLSIGARLMHDASHQLFIIMPLPGGPIQIKIAGLDWIYASQATAAGVVMSTYASPTRKAYSLTLICALLAFAHTALLVLAVAEVSKQVNGANNDLAAIGATIFKLYRIALPALLAATWITCSREMLFTANAVTYRPTPAQQPWKRAFGSRPQRIRSMPGHPTAHRTPHTSTFRNIHEKRRSRSSCGKISFSLATR